MATTPTTRYYTVDDLASFPDDGNRYEVIDGELYVTAAPHSDHQNGADEISFVFRAWDRRNDHGWALSGVGVIFAIDTGSDRAMR